jgi:Yip1 domain
MTANAPTTPANPAASPAAPNLAARIAGVVFAPRATYAAVAARPRALGVLLFVLVVGAAATYAFLSTEVGQNAVLDQQIETMKSFGMTVTQPTIDRLEQAADRQRYIAPAAQAVFLPLAAAIVAGLALAVFNAIMGGDASYRQVFAIVAHSGVLITVQQLFGLPLAYAREKMTGATNLAVFAPFLDDTSFAARLLGSIDLFILWWLVSLAIGLGVLYKKRTTPIATSLISVYVVIGVVIAAVKTALSAG